MSTMTSSAVGPLLRQWRSARHLSQLDLSTATGVSTRHLSCVETGRAKPSKELILHLAEELQVPLRDRNDLLLAADYAPVYRHRDLDDPALRPAMEVLATVVQRSEPNPTVVIDRSWNLVQTNAPALWLCSEVDPALLEPPINVARLSAHPDGLARSIADFDIYARHLLARLRRGAATEQDPALDDLLLEVEDLVAGQTGAGPTPTIDADAFALELDIEVGGNRLRLFSTIATFGAATDVTLAELSIETFYPADDATAAVLAARPWDG